MIQGMTNHSSPDVRGTRVKALRDALNLSRQKFADRLGIKKSTIQNWEEGRHTGLSEKGAKQMANALSETGVTVSVDWLMHGAGLPPKLPESSIAKVSQSIFPENLPDDQIIQQELLLFHHLNKGSIELLLPDNSMFPFYSAGDIVAGKRFFGDELINASEHDCIVQTATGEILVRYVVSHSPTSFDLFKYDAAVKKIMTHQNIKLFSAAPILWIRRKGKYTE